MRQPRDLPKGLLELNLRGVHIELSMKEDCESCGRAMVQKIQGILREGYKFRVSCSRCDAVHEVEIFRDGFRLTLL